MHGFADIYIYIYIYMYIYINVDYSFVHYANINNECNLSTALFVSSDSRRIATIRDL